jgi:hypothetical protein
MKPACEAVLEFEPRNRENVFAAFDAMYAGVQNTIAQGSVAGPVAGS